PSAADPTSPRFWFVMSMGLLVGFIFAYPMNWWLVAYHLKQGMMTVRPAAAVAGAHAGMAGMEVAPHAAMSMGSGDPPRPPIPVMALLSFLALAAGVAIAFLLRAAGAAANHPTSPRARPTVTLPPPPPPPRGRASSP